MALEPGPESRVRTPGASERLESSEVAKVRVTNGRRCDADGDKASRAGGGSRGSSRAADDSGNVSSSDMVSLLVAAGRC